MGSSYKKRLLLAILATAACGGGGSAPAPDAAPGGASSGGQAVEAGASGTAPGPSGGAGAAPAHAGGSAGATASAGGSGEASGTGGAAPTAGGSVGGSSGSIVSSGGSSAVDYPARSAVLEVLARVNQQFAVKWPDPSMPLPGNRPSNIWTRGVYYEGLLALYRLTQTPAYRDYALQWANANSWALRSSVTNADNQCAGQSYIELYELDGKAQSSQIAAVLASADGMLGSASSADWTWVDAIQMSMPVFAKLGVLTGDAKYFDKMDALYAHTRDDEGGGLYDTANHLWWRDAKWKPDRQTSPSGKNVYWSRGNGWAFAALARVLDVLPDAEPHQVAYRTDFVDMARALVAVQRDDGFFNPNLADPQHFGGPELSGTALFTFGMAWGIRHGLLDEATYGPAVSHAWQGMVSKSVHDDGFLGFVQSSGDDPSDGQPLSFDAVPDFEDFGVGCFLLAGSELAQLSPR
ncbi:MAG TPA: glycoside hydrolase family 88 protein [Polyangiaceae bacterium]|nr:glycoside hydrolase family 88 protein [Polyangiaceae bacterium]